MTETPHLSSVSANITPPLPVPGPVTRSLTRPHFIPACPTRKRLGNCRQWAALYFSQVGSNEELNSWDTYSQTRPKLKKASCTEVFFVQSPFGTAVEQILSGKESSRWNPALLLWLPLGTSIIIGTSKQGILLTNWPLQLTAKNISLLLTSSTTLGPHIAHSLFG